MVIADTGSPDTLPPGHRSQVYLPSSRSGQSHLLLTDLHPGHHAWAHLEHWASQLGLTAPQALGEITRTPAWEIAQGRPVTPADPEAAE